MKWAENHRVEGTDPAVTIGKPARRDSQTGKLKVGKFYHERYTLNGKDITKTLQTGNKKEAIRRVHERQLNGNSNQEQSTLMTIGEGFEEYFEICTHRDLAPRTIQKYKLVHREVQAQLGKRLDAPLSSYSERDFWQYHQYMLDAGHKRKTCHDRLIVIKQATKYLARVGRIKVNPLESARMSKPQSDPQPCFDSGQVAKMLTVADDYHRPIFAVMAYTGMRFGEVRDLRWEDLLLQNGKTGCIRVARGGSREMPKDRESRLIPIHPSLREHLEAITQSGERVFYDPDGSRALIQRKLLGALKRLCARCEFENPKQYKLHSFRHFFCSMAAQNNLSYRYVLSWLGHSDSKIAEMYFRMFDDTAEQAMSSIEFKEGSRSGDSEKEGYGREAEPGDSEV